MMLKKFARMTAAVILCSLMLTSASCGSGGGKTAMSLTYGGKTTTLSSNIYSYYMSYVKTMMLYQYYSGSGVTDTAQMADIPGMWSSAYKGQSIPGVKTIGDYAKLQAQTQVENVLAVIAYCKQHNLELSKTQLNDIDVKIKDIINNQYSRSASMFEAALARFGINQTIFRQIKRYEAMSGLVQTYLFDASTGKLKITDDMVNQFYQKNCARVKHILIKLSPGTKDVNGNPEKYSDEELAVRRQKADDIYNSIKNGADFDSLLSDSEDPGSASYPDGYTISKSTNFVPEFIEAVFPAKADETGMKVGEVREVESSYGIHIMKRFDLLPPAQALNTDTGGSWADYIKSQMQALALDEELKSYTSEIKTDTAQTNLFDPATSDTMFDCLELMQ